MMKTTLLAEHLCNRQPSLIRERLLRDHSFRARFELVPRNVLAIGGIAMVDQGELLAAARRVHLGEGEQNVQSCDGGMIRVLADQDGIVLRYTSSDHQDFEFRLNELNILSSQSERREKTLHDLLKYLGPTAPDFSSLCSAATDRSLNIDEIKDLLYEKSNGVVALQRRASDAIGSGTFCLDDLVPDSLEYYERFCGPAPSDSEPETYLCTVLPAYRKKLLRRDPLLGLDICLLGSLRDDLLPSKWTGDISDEELWSALKRCEPERDPYSLLGALDVALARQHDERYRDFAEQAVSKLLQEEFLRPDGIDAYKVVPLLAELVLNRINTLDRGALRAPYWKRMCAWMQAGLIARMTLVLEFDVDRLERWVRSNESAAGTYAEILDLRREPMCWAATMSAPRIREEILEGLIAIRQRHSGAGRMMPRAEGIERAISGIAERGMFLGFPGPLEGHKRPKERTLSYEQAEDLWRKYMDDSTEPAWPALAYISQIFDFGEGILARIRDKVAKANISEADSDREKLLGQMADVCLVAVAHRDTKLAEIFSVQAVACADGTCSGEKAIAILRYLLIASAAFENENAWATWLEEKLFDIATRLPRGEASMMFLDNLREIKKVVKLSLRITARAEALAIAAN